MANKQKNYKYFTPPRWSVFQTEEHAGEADLQKSGRRKRYFSPILNNEGDACHSSLSGGIEQNSTFSIDDRKVSNQNLTFEVPNEAEDRTKVSGAANRSVEVTTHTLSVLDECEMESTFHVPQSEDFTFSLPANDKKSNRQSKAHITRISGKSFVQDSSTVGKLDDTFTMTGSSTPGRVLRSSSKRDVSKLNAPRADDENLISASKGERGGQKNLRLRSEISTPAMSTIHESPRNSTQRAHGSVTRGVNARLSRSQLNSSIFPLVTETTATNNLPDLPDNCFTPSASSSPPSGGRLLKQEDSGLDTVASSVFSQTGNMDDTFTLANANASVSKLLSKVNVFGKDEVLISASKGTRSKRYFPSPETKADTDVQSMMSEAESSLMLAAVDSTFELPSHVTRGFAKLETSEGPKILGNSEMLSNIAFPGGDVTNVQVLRRSTRNKGKTEPSPKFAVGDCTFELPSHTNKDINTDISTNTPFSQTSCIVHSGDIQEVHKSGEVKVENNFSDLSAVIGSSQKSAKIARRAAQCKTKLNYGVSQLNISNLSQKEKNLVLSEGNETSANNSVPSGVKSAAQQMTRTEESSARSPSVGVLPKLEEQPTNNVSGTLSTCFSQADVTEDKENVPVAGTTSEAKQWKSAHVKSRIPVPVKHSASKETFVSKIPVPFKVQKLEYGSTTRTAVPKRFADKVNPFQFTAKPPTYSNKTTVQARGCASSRTEAAAQRRMTARCIAMKSAPRDRDGRTVKQRKNYHEMVRTNRTHELMLRRKI